MVGNGAFSHRKEWVRKLLKILYFKGHQNCIIGPTVTAIFLNCWVLPIGGVSSERVCALDKVVKLVSGGSVFNRAYLVYF